MEAIYDRNLLDISYAKELIDKTRQKGFDSLTEDEKTKWYAGLKGFLNYTDLNRIESNCKANALSLGINIVTKTDWKMTDKPALSDFVRIRENVVLIRNKKFYYFNTPSVPQIPLNHYSKINDIEKILLDVHGSITAHAKNIIYVDEIYIDEEIGVI